MTERQTPAIVLTVREYGEADLMVNFLTPGYGPLTGIAKHARKSRRRFAHCLEPLSRVVFFLSPAFRPGPGVPPERRTGKIFPGPAPRPEAAGRSCGPGRGGGSPGRPPGGL